MESMGIYHTSPSKSERVIFLNEDEKQLRKVNPDRHFACQYRIAPSQVKETA